MLYGISGTVLNFQIAVAILIISFSSAIVYSLVSADTKSGGTAASSLIIVYSLGLITLVMASTITFTSIAAMTASPCSQ